MAHVRRLLAVEADIEQVLSYTLQRFGLRKYDDYAALIQEALDALAIDPHAGKPQPAIAAEAWTIQYRAAGTTGEAPVHVPHAGTRCGRSPGACL